MCERTRLRMRLLIIMSILFSMGCEKTNRDLLAVIEGKDTITVGQFNFLLKSRFEINASKLTFIEKRKHLDAIIEERLKLAYGMEKGYEQIVHDEEERFKSNILVNKTYEKYVLSEFINDQNVEEYAQNIGLTVNSKNLIVRFKDRRESPATRTKAEARKRADSIYSIINSKNYDAIAEKMSDFKNPVTRKGNIALEKLMIGQIPYTYEKEIFKMAPNGISKPVEVPGAFVIIHLFSKDTSTRKLMEKNQVRKLMKSKFEDTDQYIVGQLHIQFLDSLHQSAQIEVLKKNIVFLATRLKDTVDISASLKLFTEEELGLRLALFKGGEVTIKRFLRNYAPGTKVKFTSDLISQAVDIFCNTLLLEKLAMDDGFMNSEEYNNALLLARQSMIIKKLDDSVASLQTEVTESELRSFFSRNRVRYRTDGSIVVSEITSPSISKINDVQTAIYSGVDFEKAAETNGGNDKSSKVKLNRKVPFNFRTRNELAARALRMKNKEISDVIARKDSSFSIIKIMNRSEPQLMSFSSAKMKVEKDYRMAEFRNRERLLLSDLKSRWKIVVHENNLCGI